MSGNPFEGFFDAIGLSKQEKQEQHTEAEELARQGRADVITHMTNFASVWPKPTITEVAPGVFEGGVDDYVSPEQLKEYREAQQRKDAVTLSGNGWTLTFDSNTVTLRTPSGIVQLSLAQYEELRAATANVSTVTPLNDAYGYVSGSQVVTSSNVMPRVKGQNELAAQHFPSQNELAAAMSSATKQNEERRQYSIKMQRESGIWGSRKGD